MNPQSGVVFHTLPQFILLITLLSDYWFYSSAFSSLVNSRSAGGRLLTAILVVITLPTNLFSGRRSGQALIMMMIYGGLCQTWDKQSLIGAWTRTDRVFSSVVRKLRSSTSMYSVVRSSLSSASMCGVESNRAVKLDELWVSRKCAVFKWFLAWKINIRGYKGILRNPYPLLGYQAWSLGLFTEVRTKSSTRR